MRFCILLSAFCLLVSFAHATQSVLDPQDAVRHVRRARSGGSMTSLDVGEFLVGTSPDLDFNFHNQESPRVASDGTDFLAIWVDRRCDDAGDIWGTRVTADGTVLDPYGFQITSGPICALAPAIAFGDSVYLIAWYDNRAGLTTDIYGTRVTRSGVVLDSAGIPICTAPNEQRAPDAAFCDSCFLIAWEDLRNLPNPSNIYAARVRSDGSVLDPDGIAITHPPGPQGGVRLAAGSDCFLAVWTESGDSSSLDVKGTRIAVSGSVLDTAGIPVAALPSAQFGASAGFDGSDFLVVWLDERRHPGTVDPDVFAARVTGQGVVLDSAGFLVWESVPEQPNLSFNGTNYLLVWSDDLPGICAARLAPDGRLIDTTAIALTTRECRGEPWVACAGGNWLVTWQVRGFQGDIVATTVSPDGNVRRIDGMPLSTSGADQTKTRAAFDGDNYLVVWQQPAKDSLYEDWGDIWAARVTASGVLLDSNPIAVSARPNCYAQHPDVSFNGADFLVVWYDNRDSRAWGVFGARVSRSGVLLDTAGMRISNGPSDEGYPVVAAGGPTWLVAWNDFRGGMFVEYIYAARVSADGVLLDTSGIPVAIGEWCQFLDAVGYDGANYLVIWEDNYTGPSDIRGRRVAPDGTILDSVAIAVTWVPGCSESDAALAFDGSNYLVTWTDRRLPDHNIYGARVSPQGVVLDSSGVRISQSLLEEDWPVVAFDGVSYVVVWSTSFQGASCWEMNLGGARVSTTGAILDTFPVTTGPGLESDPALARGADNSPLLVYSGWTTAVGGRTYNSQRIWGKLGPFPGIAETPNGEVRRTNRMPTVVRSVLFLPPGKPGQSTTGQSLVFLLDISGRKVLDLHSGANDVSRLSPGVYFIRSGPSAAGRVPSAVQKVVVQH
jgi:hypothetical protein